MILFSFFWVDDMANIKSITWWAIYDHLKVCDIANMKV
jgi:hypothetical protein